MYPEIFDIPSIDCVPCIDNFSGGEFLSDWIDKHLIVHENEKKNNAEVSTPSNLRKDMLNAPPESFWTRPKKVGDLCVGKGGFAVDIVAKFMKGLSKLIPDEKLRYKTIVETCLYIADINPLNVYICELILNPTGEYKLNTYIGNSLKLNIQTHWGSKKIRHGCNEPTL